MGTQQERSVAARWQREVLGCHEVPTAPAVQAVDRRIYRRPGREGQWLVHSEILERVAPEVREVR